MPCGDCCVLRGVGVLGTRKLEADAVVAFVRLRVVELAIEDVIGHAVWKGIADAPRIIAMKASTEHTVAVGHASGHGWNPPNFA